MKKGWGLCVVSPLISLATAQKEVQTSLSPEFVCPGGCSNISSVSGHQSSHSILTDTQWPPSLLHEPAPPVLLHALIFSFICLKSRGYIIPCSC